MMIESKTVGQRLQALRKKKSEAEGRRITQAEAADAVGIGRSTLTAYERDHDKPGRDTMSALANFYNVSIDYLIGETTPSVSDPDDIAHNDQERLLLRLWRIVGEEERRSLMILLRSQMNTNNAA